MSAASEKARALLAAIEATFDVLDEALASDGLIATLAEEVERAEKHNARLHNELVHSRAMTTPPNAMVDLVLTRYSTLEAENARLRKALNDGYTQHRDHHITLAVRRLLREVAGEAWESGWEDGLHHAGWGEANAEAAVKHAGVRKAAKVNELCGPAPGEGGKFLSSPPKPEGT